MTDYKPPSFNQLKKLGHIQTGWPSLSFPILWLFQNLTYISHLQSHHMTADQLWSGGFTPPFYTFTLFHKCRKPGGHYLTDIIFQHFVVRGCPRLLRWCWWSTVLFSSLHTTCREVTNSQASFAVLNQPESCCCFQEVCQWDILVFSCLEGKHLSH